MNRIPAETSSCSSWAGHTLAHQRKLMFWNGWVKPEGSHRACVRKSTNIPAECRNQYLLSINYFYKSFYKKYNTIPFKINTTHRVSCLGGGLCSPASLVLLFSLCPVFRLVFRVQSLLYSCKKRKCSPAPSVLSSRLVHFMGDWHSSCWFLRFFYESFFSLFSPSILFINAEWHLSRET